MYLTGNQFSCDVLFILSRMSLIGCSCLILSAAGQWKMAHIRAASQPLLTNSDLTQMRVSFYLLDQWYMHTEHEWSKHKLFSLLYETMTLLHGVTLRIKTYINI